MLKAIFAYVKAHVVVTAITTTVVVGTAVATPIVVKQIENHKEEKNNTARVDQIVNDNLDLLIKENEEIINDTQSEKTIEENNQIVDNKQQASKEQSNKNEPLTFRIEKVKTVNKGGSAAITMEGEPATTMDSTGTSYRIVPSYEKDSSEWTDADKEAYSKAVEEIANMAKTDYDEAVKREEQTIREIEEKLQQELSQYNTN